jgi:hypothetical protein
MQIAFIKLQDFVAAGRGLVMRAERSAITVISAQTRR